MGFYNGNDGSGYIKFSGVEGCSNKITEIQRAINKLSPEEVREGIEIAQQQYMRGMKNIGKVHLKTPYSKTKKEPIEYVVKESEEKVSGEER